MIDIFDAKNGLKCECTCICCGDRLIARQGSIKEWHFAHESGADCAGGVESALHLAAKQIIKNEGLIFVGSYNPVKVGLASFTHITHGEPDPEYRNQLNRILQNDHVILYKYASAELIAHLNSVKTQCNNPVIKIDCVELEKRAEGSSLTEGHLLSKAHEYVEDEKPGLSQNHLDALIEGGKIDADEAAEYTAEHIKAAAIT